MLLRLLSIVHTNSDQTSASELAAVFATSLLQSGTSSLRSVCCMCLAYVFCVCVLRVCCMCLSSTCVYVYVLPLARVSILGAVRLYVCVQG